MAIRGSGYLRTNWSFEERPVASSKLNLWDERIEAALKLTFHLICQAWGGGNGVVRGFSADDLKVAAMPSPGLTVRVYPGAAFISKFPFRIAQTMESPEIPPPAAQNRIDLLQANLDTWGVTIKRGTEAATPAAPNPDAHCLALARLYLRPGMTCIKNSNDGVNGYIIDARVYV